MNDASLQDDLGFGTVEGTERTAKSKSRTEGR